MRSGAAIRALDVRRRAPNVRRSAGDLTEMLGHTGCGRDVPVIVENGRVTIGYDGS